MMQKSNPIVAFKSAFSFILLVACGLPLSGQSNTEDSILAKAKKWAESLASPSMHGRGYQLDGHRIAAQYLAEEFSKLGLEPHPTLKDETNPFFQTFHMSTNVVQGDAVLAVGTDTLQIGHDYVVNAASGRGNLKGSKVVDLGFGMPEDFKKSLEKCVVVMRPGLPPEIEKDSERKKVMQPLATDAQKIERATRMKAAAIVMLRPKLTAGLSPIPANLPILDVLNTKWPKKKVKKANISVETGLKGIQSQNVVAMIPGTIHPDSIVLVCAHYDHLGRQGEAIFYGGNDNASGTSMLLSMADHFARPENQPRFTMLFVAFGGEEAGLVGSTYFASKAPVVPLANIRFLLNLDLMSNGSEGIMAVAGNENPIELQVLRGLNDTLQAVKEVKSRPNAANSDHYPFVSRGVKGIFIYTMGGPPHYHDVNDTFANMEFQRYSEIRALLIRFLSELMQAQ